MVTDIHVWYGDSNTSTLGPLTGLLIEHNPQGRSKIQITDEKWLDQMGMEGEEYFYTCTHLPADNYVSYDDYAWCYPGECDIETEWW